MDGAGAGETSYQAYDLAVAAEAERTLAELKEQREKTDKPFFLLISLFCPHPPYIARRSDFEKFENALPAPRLPQPTQEHPSLAAWRKAGRTNEISEEATAKSRAAYYGLVRLVDQIAGRITSALEGRENTVTIYASDHGESLGERGLWWKSTMYDESAKVPLIIRAPGMSAGAVDQRVVSLMDLSATILKWADAAALPGHVGRDLRVTEDWADTISSSYYGGLMNIEVSDIRHRMLRDGRYKLMWFDGAQPMLFDLEADPNELHDLSNDPNHAESLSHLTKKLHARWYPKAIAARQAIYAKRVSVIRDWVRKTNPPEPLRWIDPNKARNRYE